MKLTKRSVEAITPGLSDLVVWDEHVPGFGVRVKPSGVRSYLVQYRNLAGRSRRSSARWMNLDSASVLLGCT